MAALIIWLLIAGGGFVLLSISLARGGMRQQREAGNRIRPAEDEAPQARHSSATVDVSNTKEGLL